MGSLSEHPLGVLFYNLFVKILLHGNTILELSGNSG